MHMQNKPKNNKSKEHKNNKKRLYLRGIKKIGRDNRRIVVVVSHHTKRLMAKKKG